MTRTQHLNLTPKMNEMNETNQTSKQTDSKWKEFEVKHETIVKAEAYTKDIFTEEEKDLASQIYAKRMVNYFNLREKAGYHGLNLGNVHK